MHINHLYNISMKQTKILTLLHIILLYLPNLTTATAQNLSNPLYYKKIVVELPRSIEIYNSKSELGTFEPTSGCMQIYDINSALIRESCGWGGIKLVEINDLGTVIAVREKEGGASSGIIWKKDGSVKEINVPEDLSKDLKRVELTGIDEDDSVVGNFKNIEAYNSFNISLPFLLKINTVTVVSVENKIGGNFLGINKGIAFGSIRDIDKNNEIGWTYEVSTKKSQFFDGDYRISSLSNTGKRSTSYDLDYEDNRTIDAYGSGSTHDIYAINLQNEESQNLSCAVNFHKESKELITSRTAKGVIVLSERTRATVVFVPTTEVIKLPNFCLKLQVKINRDGDLKKNASNVKSDGISISDSTIHLKANQKIKSKYHFAFKVTNELGEKIKRAGVTISINEGKVYKRIFTDQNGQASFDVSSNQIQPREDSSALYSVPGIVRATKQNYREAEIIYEWRP